MSRARTLLVAVNDVFLDGVVDWIACDARLEVVGRAHSGSNALGSLASLHGELVLADVTLPDMSGFEVARRIKSQPDAPLVVLFSFHDSLAAREEARAAGADGFVVTSEMAERLLPLVEDLLRRRDSAVARWIPDSRKMRVPPPDGSC